MSNLLTINFWFKMRPGALLPVYQKAFIIFVIILGLSILVFTILEKRKKGPYSRVWKKLRSFSLGNVIIGLIILFFTYEMVPMLSARFWFLVWGIEMAIWLFFIARVVLEIPKKKEEIEKHKEFNKYIP